MQAQTAVAQYFWNGVAVLAAALGGFALVLWLAANWDSLGLMPQALLLQASLVAAGAGAVLMPRLRSAFGVFAFCLIGGLLAWLGQTYQSSADAWQLFLLWTLFTLPLCLALRTEALWLPWVLVAGCTVALWLAVNERPYYEARVYGDAATHAVAALAAVLPLLLTAVPLRRYSGAAAWSLRAAALVLAVIAVRIGISALWHEGPEPGYYVALLVVAAVTALFVWRRWFDLPGLSLLVLALDTLVVCGIGYVLFKTGNSDGDDMFIFLFVLIGLIAMAVLGVSALGLARLARAHAAGDGSDMGERA